MKVWGERFGVRGVEFRFSGFARAALTSSVLACSGCTCRTMLAGLGCLQLAQIAPLNMRSLNVYSRLVENGKCPTQSNAPARTRKSHNSPALAGFHGKRLCSGFRI